MSQRQPVQFTITVGCLNDDETRPVAEQLREAVVTAVGEFAAGTDVKLAVHVGALKP